MILLSEEKDVRQSRPASFLYWANRSGGAGADRMGTGEWGSGNRDQAVARDKTGHHCSGGACAATGDGARFLMGFKT